MTVETETPESEQKTFPAEVVTDLRRENGAYRNRLKREPFVFAKGYLPAGITRDTSDIAVHINKFPLGGPENFSVSRACYAMLMSKRRYGRKMDSAVWAQLAPWEKKYIDALNEVSLRLADGVEVEIKAQGDAVSGVDGGFLAPEIWSGQYFQILTSISALDGLPITRFNVPARVLKIPKTALDVTVSYPGENTAPTATNYSFGQVEFTARKADILINAGIELMRDSPLFNDQLLREEGARSMAVDRDQQAFSGQGGSNPTGITFRAQAGSPMAQVGTFTPAADAGNGGLAGYADYIGAKYQAQHLSTNANVTNGQAICDGVVANMRVEKAIQAILDTSNRPIWPTSLESGSGQDGGRGGFIGIPSWKLVADTVLPITIAKGSGSTLTNVIFGAWRNAVLFDCLSLGFDITEEALGMQNAQAQIRIIHRWDFGLAHPEAFVVMPTL